MPLPPSKLSASSTYSSTSARAPSGVDAGSGLDGCRHGYGGPKLTLPGAGVLSGDLLFFVGLAIATAVMSSHTALTHLTTAHSFRLDRNSAVRQLIVTRHDLSTFAY